MINLPRALTYPTTTGARQRRQRIESVFGKSSGAAPVISATSLCAQASGSREHTYRSVLSGFHFRCRRPPSRCTWCAINQEAWRYPQAEACAVAARLKIIGFHCQILLYTRRSIAARAARTYILAMSRFVNLEFGDEHEDHSHDPQAGLVKDEAYYFAEAETAFQNGNFESALRLYAKVLEYNPQKAPAWTGQVRMLIELGQIREAKLWADKALEHFPSEPELLAAKAVALGRSGDLQAALVGEEIEKCPQHGNFVVDGSRRDRAVVLLALFLAAGGFVIVDVRTGYGFDVLPTAQDPVGVVEYCRVALRCPGLVRRVDAHVVEERTNGIGDRGGRALGLLAGLVDHSTARDALADELVVRINTE